MTRTAIGWREWVELPDLGVDRIKAKVDTGAATSSLHAFDLRLFERNGASYVRFVIHPKQRTSKARVECEAPLIGERRVRNPGGRLEVRPIIATRIILAGVELEAEINLTRRDEMGFRMLLGRRTIRDSFVVDPGRSYLGNRPVRAQNRLS